MKISKLRDDCNPWYKFHNNIFTTQTLKTEEHQLMEQNRLSYYIRNIMIDRP